MDIKKRRRERLALVGFLLTLLLMLAVLTVVLTPKRQDFGSTWGRYAKEERDTVDIMFFGSSIVYCDVVPAVIYEETGLTSYVMAGPEQTIPITYYYIKEALRTQSPQAVFVEVTGVFFRRYQDFTKANLSFMPFSVNRLEATFNAAEKEERLGLLFPLYNYHDRWKELGLSDLTGYTADELAGYTLLTEAMEGAEPGWREVEFDADNYADNLAYLRQMAELCAENGAELTFFIAPTYWRLEGKYLDMLKGDIAEIEGAAFIDYNEDFDDIGIDDAVDFFDLLHFNCRGAVKFSRYMKPDLEAAGAIPTADDETRALWDARAEYFYALSSIGT